MAPDLPTPARDGRIFPPEPPVAWSAILAGAVVALATSILLTLLAAGFGLALIPAGLASRSALSAFTPTLGAGAVCVQVVSAGFGGFVAGRLRHPWSAAHTDEAHFRDTAHGLIAWALSAVAGLVLAALVFVPYAEGLAAQTPMPAGDALRAAGISAQAALFTAVGMLLSAFTAAVAARLGGMEGEHMHAKAAGVRAAP
jgi:hypothetical protein